MEYTNATSAAVNDNRWDASLTRWPGLPGDSDCTTVRSILELGEGRHESMTTHWQLAGDCSTIGAAGCFQKG